MDSVQPIIAWAMENGPLVISALVAIHLAAVAVVRITPTTKDDEVVGVIGKAITWLANITNPEKPQA